ncbi:MAG TPA: hypothetical protein VGK63_03630 [Candidatus Limnocylindrales bacterium]
MPEAARLADEAAAAYDILELAEQTSAVLAGPGYEAVARRLLGAGERVPDAVEWLIAHDRRAAVRLVAALPRFWQDAGLVDLGRALTERVLATVDAASLPVPPRYAAAIVAAAELAFRQGDQAAAEAHASRAVVAAREAGDPETEALACVNLARVAFRAGDAAAIERFAGQALAIEDAGPLARRGGLHMLAWAAHTAGDLDEAERRFEASLAYRRELGDRFSVAVEIANLGDLAFERGNLVDAARRHAAVLSMARDLDNRYLVVNELPSLAAIAVRSGDPEAAARLLGAADAVAEASGIVPDPGADRPVEAELAERLEPAVVVSLRTEGARLGLAEAMSLAMSVASRMTSERE